MLIMKDLNIFLQKIQNKNMYKKNHSTGLEGIKLEENQSCGQDKSRDGVI